MENTYIEQIEAYLNGELSAKARADLEQTIAQDANLQSEFDKRQLAHQAIEVLIEDDLRATLRNLEAKEQDAAPTQEAKVRTMGRNRRLFLLSAAASAAVLIGFFGLQFFGQGNSPEQLAMDYYEAPSFEVRGTDTNLNRLKAGLDAMKTKDYPTAIQAFDAIPASDDYYVGAQCNRAHALYLQGKYEAAMAGFQIAARGNDPRYTEQAQWYGILACLAANKGGECMTKLDAILADDGHSYYGKARALKEKL